MRIIIVGAGAVGSMAAWRMAQAGHDVTVFEQFGLDHDRGSSFGDSRVVRRLYADPFYTALMASAYPLWEEFQDHFPDRELFAPSGGVFFGPRDHRQIVEAEAALASSAVEYERLGPKECARRFPALKLRGDEVALFEPSMGYARASRCVRAAVQLAQSHGAIFHFETPIRVIKAVGEGVEVTTEAGEVFAADRLLIGAGPWAQRLLGELGMAIPVKIVRKTYLHLRPARCEADFEVGQFPVWIDAAQSAYGFPRLGELPGVKIAFHEGGEETSPDAVNRELQGVDRQPLLEYAAARFPDLSGEIVYEKVCLYTSTPDEDFIIDRVPQFPGAVFIAGLSGHGFKFAPLLGQIALDLLAEVEQPHDLSRFALSRFFPKETVSESA